MLKQRLSKLEHVINKLSSYDQERVFFVDLDDKTDLMHIPDLNFTGTAEDGHTLMGQYPNAVFLIDDISCWEEIGQ